MKKLISKILVLVIVLSTSVTTVFASPGNYKGNNWIPPGQMKKMYTLPKGIAKKLFYDLDDFPWAKKAIERMKAKGLIEGYEDETFAPKETTTKLDTIKMIIRVMGWEDEVESTNYLPKNYKINNISATDKGYITTAYEKGIIDDVDMIYFNPQEPVRRYEIAKYLIKALGYDEEGQEHMDEELPFVDASVIPKGSTGYIYLACHFNLMGGSSSRIFNPLGILTRAELAVVFQRLDDLVDSTVDKDEIIGQVCAIEDEEITLKVDGKLKTFEVDDDVIVYEGNKRARYSSIEVGSTVLVQFDDDEDDKEVVYIEILDESDYSNVIVSVYNGEVTDIKSSKQPKLTVQIKKMEIVFEVKDNVQVYFKDGKGKFDEIDVNDNVTVVVDKDNRATKIIVDRKRYDDKLKIVKGKITDIDLVGICHIWIDNERYMLPKDTKVNQGTKILELNDLEKGMEIEVKLRENTIESIQVIPESLIIEGTIESVNGYRIIIQKKDGKNVSYLVSRSAHIKILGKTKSTIKDLDINDFGEFEIKDNIVTKIEIDNKYRSVKGIVEKINSDSIKIRVNNRLYVYKYASAFTININGHSDKYRNLKEGMKIDLRIKNNLIYKIYAQDNKFELKGKIDTITQISDGYKITLEVNKKKTTYKVYKNIDIRYGNKTNLTINDLKVGHKVKFTIENDVIIKITI